MPDDKGIQMKKIVTIVLTVLVFLSAVFIGVSNAYRIDNVMVEAKTYSQAAKSEAQQLQQELKEGYVGENLLFTDEEIALTVIADYPYFRLTKFERQYPDLLCIEVTEDAEVFAVETAQGYYILSQNGTILDIRADYHNRADGEENVVIAGGNPTGEVGQKVQGAGFDELLKMCMIMSDYLNGVRSNIERILFDDVEDGGRIFLWMREGVRINVMRPHLLTEEKAKMFTEKYLSLSDEERLTGFIHATESLDETRVLIEYRANDLT